MNKRRIKLTLIVLAIAVCGGSLGACTSTSYKDRCYRSSCENRPLYWHELWED